MEFTIGQIVQNDRNYTAAAMWCNTNNAFLLDNGDGTYTITANQTPTLEEVKKTKVQEINKNYASTVSAVKADTVQEEVDTWDIQRLEALAWESDNTSPTSKLDIIALNRGMERITFINRTLTKTKQFEEFVFTLLGKKQKYEDMIEAATTIEAVQAIVWE